MVGTRPEAGWPNPRGGRQVETGAMHTD